MIRKVIPKDKSNKLYLAIEANLSSFRKRSISYVINAESDDLATIILNVTGKRGTVSKSMIAKYDTLNGWEVYSSGVKYTLASLSELSTIVRTVIAAMSTTITKI